MVSNIKYNNLLEWLQYGRCRSNLEGLNKIMKEMNTWELISRV